MNKKPEHIFIDCTATYTTGLNTGIQRVVKNIISRIDTAEKKYGIKCVPIILKDGEFIQISPQDLLSRRASKSVSNIKVLLSKILPSKLYFFAKELYGKLFLVFAKPSIKAPVIVPKRDDLIFGPDVFWEMGFMDAVYKYTSKYQTKFILLVYDIIPILYPSYYRDQTPKKFKKYFQKTLYYHAILTTSYSNIDQIKSLKDSEYPGISEKPIDVFYLGSNISDTCDIDIVSKELKSIVKSGAVFLMVGTLEPRKNHDIVLSAFEKIWQQDQSKKLIIVGRIGWLCEKTLKRIKSSRYYNKNLFLFNRLNDNDLVYLYKNSQALITASTIEGFGLPIAEAICYGIKVIASDIPVFREIGGDYPIYFDLSKLDSLISAIDKVHNFAVKPKKSLSWDESIEQMFEKLINLYNKID